MLLKERTTLNSDIERALPSYRLCTGYDAVGARYHRGEKERRGKKEKFQQRRNALRDLCFTPSSRSAPLLCKQPMQWTSERQLRARGSGALRCFDPRPSHTTTRGRLIWFPARLLCPCECLSRTLFEVNLPERESRLLQVGPSTDWMARHPSRWKNTSLRVLPLLLAEDDGFASQG